MQLEWHESKRQTNFRKYGIDFVDVIRLFDGEAMLLEDSRFSYDEERFWLVGFLGKVLVIVTYTVIEQNTIRIISARKATKHEQRRFLT